MQVLVLASHRCHVILMYGRRWQAADLPALKTELALVLQIKIILKKAIASLETLDHSRLADIQRDTCSPEYHYISQHLSDWPLVTRLLACNRAF